MPIRNSIADLAAEMTAWRRDIHAHPELGRQEHRTSDLVARMLESWGIAVTRGLAGTGIVGTLRAGSSDRAIGIRADMDALPMQEVTGLPYASVHEGVMHACGHDGHTTMLLGAARYLAETRNFDGTVHFIFQPDEEGDGGGRVMVEEGLFDRFPCDSVYALHTDPSLPVGMASAVAGPINAAADRVTIRILGKGGHAARPHLALDPILVGCHVYMALQSIVARRIDPLDSAVLSLCQFHAGTARNVIPEDAVLNGTIRTLRPEVRDRMQDLITSIARATAEAHGAAVEIEYGRGYPSVINADSATEKVAAAAAEVLGAAQVIRERPPSMGAEDFSYMAQKAPGCMIRLGQAGADKGRVSVHNPKFDFNDDALPIGASIWAALVERELGRGG